MCWDEVMQCVPWFVCYDDGHSSQEHHVCLFFSCFHSITPAPWTKMTHSIRLKISAIGLGHCVLVSTGCRVFKSHFLQSWMWIIRKENDRYMSSWGVHICVKAAWATDKVRRSGNTVFSLSSSSSPLRRWTIAQSKSQTPSPCGAPQGSHRSDINKKSQLTTLFKGLMSLCEVSHLSGVKAVMAAVCVCVFERKLEPWRIWGVYV